MTNYILFIGASLSILEILEMILGNRQCVQHYGSLIQLELDGFYTGLA